MVDTWWDAAETKGSRKLTREEQGILDIALLKSLKLIFDSANETTQRVGSMQDGMLAHYLGQAGAADVNVEAKIGREVFDYRTDISTHSTTRSKASTASSILNSPNDDPLKV